MTDEETLELFAEAVGRPEDELDLAAATLLIAQAEYPDLDREFYAGVLDRLAGEGKGRTAQEAGPYGVANALSEYLFDEQGFRGNEDDYYDPRNSYLNDVLERRLGIPITLAVVYIEVGRRLGLPIVGVGLPGHFLVKYLTPDEEIIIDPFHRGIILSEEECADLVSQTAGRPLPWRPEYLAPVSKKQILARMLNNLKGIYLSKQDDMRALAAVDRLLLIDGQDLHELRDRGRLRCRVGDLRGALADLESYLAAVPQAPDEQAVRRYTEAIRQRLEGEG